MKPPEPLLILDGHTNQALACARSLGAAGHRVLVASHERFPLAAWSRHCRGRYRLRGQSPEEFAELRGWAWRQGVRVLLPLTERSCLLSNAGRAEWEAVGVTVGCGPAEMLDAAFDKARTLRHAEDCGVRVPPTRVPGSLDECLAAAEEVGFPCVVKPRWSNAWDGSRFRGARAPDYVTGRTELVEAARACRRHGGWPLVQGFVPGRGKGVFALADRGRVLAWFAHERLRDTRPTGSGSSLRRSVPLEARLREPSERLLAEMKWHGPAMVEFRDDGTNPPCLMEVNGRFWGSLQLAVDAGINFPLLWVSLLSGRAPAPVATYEEGVTLRWLQGDVKRFVRILRGAPPSYPGTYPTVWQGLRELLGPQPAETRHEIWRHDDPWPVVGEWVGNFEELITRCLRPQTKFQDRRAGGPRPTAGPVADN
jgi:predicted ATP-grasp superfamily ATP-dependent carboligase